jgi:hypothetical protein
VALPYSCWRIWALAKIGQNLKLFWENFSICLSFSVARLAKYLLGRKIPGSNLEELNIFYLLHTLLLLLGFEAIGCEGAHQIFYNILIFRSLLPYLFWYSFEEDGRN